MSDIIPSPLSTPQLRRLKGRALARIDHEQKMLVSGPLGAERLILNIALDYMERHPSMSREQAIFAAQAYFDRAHN
ncbi:hypothetical protein V0R50_06530 [Pseudomonas sp. 148P]|uniref:Uncharacterized protein n=1 Tax=Pseudomonas ulcerans TaxID=3115852 RepID=A0ABU7HMW9_9PSED|nr:hypothetical protein [Pseudomonas sp. 148P]